MPKRPRVDEEYEDEEYDTFHYVVDQILDHPKTQELFDKAGEFFDGFGEIIKQRVNDLGNGKRVPPPPHTKTRARPRVKPQPPRPSPRTVLGFSETEPLTKKKVRERRRALAHILHPDKGGDQAAMQRINSAAESLLATL